MTQTMACSASLRMVALSPRCGLQGTSSTASKEKKGASSLDTKAKPMILICPLLQV